MVITFLEQDKLLQKDRTEARASKGRIAYDCFNAVLLPPSLTKGRGNDRVSCQEGHILSRIAKDKCCNLFFIERGGLPGVCAKCPDFDEGGLEPL